MEEIAKILPAVFKRHARRGNPPVVEMLAPLWGRVTGKAVAAQTRPVAFQAGRLTLATASPTWAAELGELRGQILEAVNACLGAPVAKELRVRVVRELAPRRSEPPHPATPARPPEAVDFDLRSQPRGEGSRLDAETARVLERSFHKYFSRPRKGLD